MLLRLIAAVIGSSVFSVGVIYALLLTLGEADSAYGQRLLANAVGRIMSTAFALCDCVVRDRVLMLL